MEYNVRQRKGDPADPENWSATTAKGKAKGKPAEPFEQSEVVEEPKEEGAGA